MIAVTVKNLKGFMHHLLLAETFDHFQVSEASITTFATFSIDGTLHPEFYDSDTAQLLKSRGASRIFWKNIKPFCLSVIKGKHTPLSFRIILQLSPAKTAQLIEQAGLSLQPSSVRGLFLNCQYSDGTLLLTTGSSLDFFTMDKSLDRAWDDALSTFLASHEID